VCKPASPPLLIALENLQDPGNLGTIIRTAEGAGVTGVIMSKDTVDIYNPKVVRSTMGSIFRIPFCYVEDFVEEMKRLNDSGIVTFSAHLQGTSFYDQNYRKPTAFVIGNEGNGLTDAVSGVTCQKISIPMMGQVESLNAATAATVLMYEAMRQRTS
jgi:TrmH family RNA methyltransferase